VHAAHWLVSPDGRAADDEKRQVFNVSRNRLVIDGQPDRRHTILPGGFSSVKLNHGRGILELSISSYAVWPNA
jgi:hypothetical protein